MPQFCYFRLYSGIKTVSLSSIATDGRDGHGLKVVKAGNTFSSFNVLPVKSSKKVLITSAP